MIPVREMLLNPHWYHLADKIKETGICQDSRFSIPVSSFSPNRMAKMLASVPAFFLSPVLIFKVYVVDMAVRQI